MIITVKELINELLECPMDSEVKLRIKLHNMDLEYDDFEVEVEKYGGGWGRSVPHLSVNLEHKDSQKFAEEDLEIDL